MIGTMTSVTIGCPTTIQLALSTGAPSKIADRNTQKSGRLASASLRRSPVSVARNGSIFSSKLLTPIRSTISVSRVHSQKPPRNDLYDESVFRLFVEQVTDYAIFLLTPTGEVASWNPGAERIKGYKAHGVS